MKSCFDNNPQLGALSLSVGPIAQLKQTLFQFVSVSVKLWAAGACVRAKIRLRWRFLF